MISVAEAQSLVREQAIAGTSHATKLGDALGLVLGESATSDVDSPPHDKSMVDGYAVVAADLSEPGRTLDVIEEITAGMIPTRPLEPGSAARIMTGAPIPEGADAVVMIERTELRTGADGASRVQIREQAVPVGQNILPQATSLRRGEQVVLAGDVLRPIEIGVLAEIGYAQVQAIPRPVVGVLATGDELVPAGESPGAAKIRNSNGPLLAALVETAGGCPRDLGIARDSISSLSERIAKGLKGDVLLLSGGVSAGVLDLVPKVFQELGVRQVFHKVSVKPGKPVWFGVRSEAGRPTLVFGLPGNPVSSLVCFELFVRPALAKLSGRQWTETPLLEATLANDARQHGNRPTYFPSQLTGGPGGYRVETLPWKGSADQRTLLRANCFALLPPGDHRYESGDSVQVVPMTSSQTQGEVAFMCPR